MYRGHNNKQVSQIYLSPDIQPGAYSVLIDVLLQRNNERQYWRFDVQGQLPNFGYRDIEASLVIMRKVVTLVVVVYVTEAVCARAVVFGVVE